MRVVPATRERLDVALWRAVAVFRVTALLYAASSVAAHLTGYASPGAGVVVLVLMTGWTVLTVTIGRLGRRWLVADLVIALAAQQASALVLTAEAVRAGDPTLPVAWASVPVAAWAVHAGWRAGALAGLTVAAGAVVERQGFSQATTNSCVLLVLLGGVVGYLVEIARRAEQAYAEAVRREAETRERERLAREVHDGVLQALALVARRSDDAELVALALGQEQALRRLVAGPAVVVAGSSDLRGLLPARPGVEVSAPATAVTLPAATATQLAAAVAAAVDNALQHGGGAAWLLVEDLGDEVMVSVRDDGPGIAAGRLAAAVVEGRMGHVRSVVGRVEELGGTVAVLSTPGQGTEVELRVPR